MTRKKSNPAPDQAALVEQVKAAFDVFRLPKARERFEQLLAAPEPGASRMQWLWAVLEPQLRARVESRIERRIRESRLPARKTLAEFDFDFQKDLDRDLVLELATLGFVDVGWNLLLAGWSGTGKSHLAMALALNACLDNRRVRYTTSENLLMTLNASLADDTLEQALKPFTRPELLLIDEVGLEQVERTTASRSGLLQKVLLPRYLHHRSTIITSNIDWKDWGDYLGDHLGAAAILDRLIHRSHVLVIEGPSYREHEHQSELNASRTTSSKKRAAKPKKAPPSA